MMCEGDWFRAPKRLRHAARGDAWEEEHIAIFDAIPAPEARGRLGAMNSAVSAGMRRGMQLHAHGCIVRDSSLRSCCL